MKYTAKLPRLEHQCFVYHGWFEFIFVGNSTDSSRKQRNFMEFFLFYHENGITFFIKDWKDIPKLIPFILWPGTIINPQWLKLSMSSTIFHGPKDVQVIAVWLHYKIWQLCKWNIPRNARWSTTEKACYIPFCQLLNIIIMSFEYRNKPKYWDTLSTYHTCPKVWNSPLNYLLMCLEYCCMYGKQCRPWSDAAFCCVWPGSTLFAKAYLSQYLGLLR